MKAIIVTMSDTRHESKQVEVEKVLKTYFRTSDGSRFSNRTCKLVGKPVRHIGECWVKTVAVLEGSNTYAERLALHADSKPGDYWHIEGVETQEVDK